MRYALIFCFLIALVYVIVKLLLEHQESEDKAKGIQQPHEQYTMFGMLKAIRAERKEKRAEKKLRKQERKALETPVEPISVRPFAGKNQSEEK